MPGLGVADDNDNQASAVTSGKGFGGPSDIRLDQQMTFHMFYQFTVSAYIGMYHPPDDYVLLPGPVNLSI